MTIITTKITSNLARYIALPIVSAGIAGGAALGMATAANATTAAGPAPSISSTADGNFHSPTTYATPAYTPAPGIRAWREAHRTR